MKLDKHFQNALREFLKGKAVDPRNAELWTRYMDPANTDREMEDVAEELEREWPDPYKYRGPKASGS